MRVPVRPLVMAKMNGGSRERTAGSRRRRSRAKRRSGARHAPTPLASTALSAGSPLAGATRGGVASPAASAAAALPLPPVDADRARLFSSSLATTTSATTDDNDATDDDDDDVSAALDKRRARAGVTSDLLSQARVFVEQRDSLLPQALDVGSAQCAARGARLARRRRRRCSASRRCVGAAAAAAAAAGCGRYGDAALDACVSYDALPVRMSSITFRSTVGVASLSVIQLFSPLEQHTRCRPRS